MSINPPCPASRRSAACASRLSHRCKIQWCPKPYKDWVDNILMEPHMPWTSNSIFEARRNFVTLALTPNSNIRGLCRRFNISANTGYQTLERYRAEGEKGLQDRSRAPHRRPLRCSKATEQAVLSGRADHPTWGGRKIASHLQLFGAATVPAPSTITSSTS